MSTAGHKPTIRVARDSDLDRLSEIERDAGAPFRAIGMDAVADDDPPGVAELGPYAAAGRACVAVDDSDSPDGYLIAEVVDGEAHIEQVSVLPAWSRQGLGRALIERAVAWAAQAGFAAVTLTTFTEVPWNGPYYERLGFEYVPPDQIGPELAGIRAQERRRGLDAWPRACMRRAV